MIVDKQSVLKLFEENKKPSPALPLAITAGAGAVGAGFKMAHDAEHMDHHRPDPVSVLKGVGSIANQLLGHKD